MNADQKRLPKSPKVPKIGIGKTSPQIAQIGADQGRQKSEPQTTRRNTEENQNVTTDNTDDTDQERTKNFTADKR